MEIRRFIGTTILLITFGFIFNILKYTVNAESKIDSNRNVSILVDISEERLYLRTPSKTVVSEATVACYLRKNIIRIMAKNTSLSITKIIKNKQVDLSFYEDLQVS